MKYLIIISLLVLIIWMVYEIWRAPLVEETGDGKIITKKPTKKLSDLWQKRN